MTYLPLLGILVVVLGFALRFNPLFVVTISAFVTGLLGGLGTGEVVDALGKGFNDNRYISVVWIVLPVIGLLERYGLQQRAKTMIANLRAATTGRLLLAYLIFRQATAALGLTSVAGHAQTVRPLVGPMAEAAAENVRGPLDPRMRDRVLGMAAATDNVGLFFGEDIFVAIASILLIQGVFEGFGIQLTPLQLSVWAIPTAVLAFLIHGGRLLAFDREIGTRKPLPPAGGVGVGMASGDSLGETPPTPGPSPEGEGKVLP